MQISKQGIALIKRFEGLRNRAYKCSAGVWTIGYGHTKGVKAGQAITTQQAEEMLQADLKNFEDWVSKLVKVELTQGQFDALVSFCFNLGPGALDSSTLLKLVNQQKFALAADQFKRWNKAGGVELAGLTKRRQAERDLFVSKAGDTP